MEIKTEITIVLPRKLVEALGIMKTLLRVSTMSRKSVCMWQPASMEKDSHFLHRPRKSPISLFGQKRMTVFSVIIAATPVTAIFSSHGHRKCRMERSLL